MLTNICLFKNNRSGIYYIQYTKHGVRKQKTTKQRTKSEATIVLQQFLTSHTTVQNSEITVQQFKEEYKKFSQGFHSPATQSAVVDGFRWFEKRISNRTLSSIGLKDLDQFITYLRVHKSVHTARKHYITLAAAFQKAVEWEYLHENLWRKVKKPKPPLIDAPFITLEEFRKVLDAVPSMEVRNIVSVAFNTGMRRGEVMQLRWDSIDFKERMLTVQNTDTFTTKSRKQRSIPMNDSCYEAIQQQRQTQSESIFVFTVLADMVQHQFKRACRAVYGDDTKLHFHSLRHSFCSNLVRNGADIKVVQSLAGHSSIAVTEKYTHYVRSDAVKAVQLLASVDIVIFK
ncbi:MAG: site-specific integrase [Bacteroidota bacterium]